MSIFTLAGVVSILLGLVMAVAWFYGKDDSTGRLSVGDVKLNGPFAFLLIIFGFILVSL
jgi:hypothetical protein